MEGPSPTVSGDTVSVRPKLPPRASAQTRTTQQQRRVLPHLFRQTKHPFQPLNRFENWAVGGIFSSDRECTKAYGRKDDERR